MASIVAAENAAAPTGVSIPKGYRSWQVVAPSQRDDKDEIRVILGNDIAMKAYRAKTLPFPDGAILAKLAWKRAKSAEFDNTLVPGEPQRIEFMVKNAKKYAATGGWGFGRFVNGKPAGHVAYQPWQCDVTKYIQPGENTIEVCVIGTLKNTLGPHHAGTGSGSAWPVPAMSCWRRISPWAIVRSTSSLICRRIPTANPARPISSWS